jgi:hypothetical protein
MTTIRLITESLGLVQAAECGGRNPFAFRILDASDAGSDSSRSGNEPDLAPVVGYCWAARGIAGGKPRHALYPCLSEKVPFFNGLLEASRELNSSGTPRAFGWLVQFTCYASFEKRS